MVSLGLLSFSPLRLILLRVRRLNAQRPTLNAEISDSGNRKQQKTHQAATDAKQRPGFQTGNRGKGFPPSDLGEQRVSIKKEEKRSNAVTGYD
jgi:hypothetical protein